MKNDEKFLEKMKKEQENGSNSKKGGSSFLGVLAIIFYSIGGIVLIYAITSLGLGDMEFNLMFFAYAASGLFIMSWGALLDGIQRIITNTTKSSI